MIKEFSLENFRVFRDKTNFKIRPITILTGPNNSGKSSVNKALLFLKENFTDSKIQYGVSNFPDVVNFYKGSHFLGNFNKIASFDSSKNFVPFKFDIKIPEINHIFHIAIDLSNKGNNVFFNKIEVYQKDIFKVLPNS